MYISKEESKKFLDLEFLCSLRSFADIDLNIYIYTEHLNNFSGFDHFVWIQCVLSMTYIWEVG